MATRNCPLVASRCGPEMNALRDEPSRSKCATPAANPLICDARTLPSERVNRYTLSPVDHRREVDARLQRARLAGLAIVLTVVSAGVAVAAVAADGTVWRELALALVSGGVVGGAFVSVEVLLAGASEARSEHDALVTQLSSTGGLDGIDLSERELRGLYLPGRSLVAARLVGAHLEETKLYFGNLRHADLHHAFLNGADLSGSTAAFADLRQADLRDAVLMDVDLSHCALGGADLRGAVLTNGRLQQASLAGAKLAGFVVRNSFLEGADFSAAEIGGAVLEGNRYDATTLWPNGYVPAPSVEVTQEDFASMDLPAYLAWRAKDGGVSN